MLGPAAASAVRVLTKIQNWQLTGNIGVCGSTACMCSCCVWLGEDTHMCKEGGREMSVGVYDRPLLWEYQTEMEELPQLPYPLESKTQARGYTS